MTLLELIEQLTEAKATETEANAHRFNIELSILNHPDVINKLKTEGTTTFKESGLSVTTGFTRSWDAEKLLDLSTGIREDFFPFKQVLTEDRKAAKNIEAEYPELWLQLASALTLKAKKPALSIKSVAS